MTDRKELLETISALTKDMKAFDWHPKRERGEGENRYYLDEKQAHIIQETFQLLRKMKFLLKMQDFRDLKFDGSHAIEKPLGHDVGAPVRVRPCGKEYEDRTYLGFLIGDVALSPSVKIEESSIVAGFGYHNPAIFVPSLQRIIYGCESWWQEIKSEDDLSDITDDDINNTWYMKIMKGAFSRRQKGGKSA